MQKIIHNDKLVIHRIYTNLLFDIMSNIQLCTEKKPLYLYHQY